MATIGKLIFGLLALLFMVNALPLEGQQDLALNKGLPFDEDPDYYLVDLRKEITMDDRELPDSQMERGWCCSGYGLGRGRG